MYTYPFSDANTDFTYASLSREQLIKLLKHPCIDYLTLSDMYDHIPQATAKQILMQLDKMQIIYLHDPEDMVYMPTPIGHYLISGSGPMSSEEADQYEERNEVLESHIRDAIELCRYLAFRFPGTLPEQHFQTAIQLLHWHDACDAYDHN